MARRFFLFLLVVGLTTLASATKIQTSDPNCTSGTPIGPGDNITFTATGGGGVFTFCNETGTDWKNLLITIETTIPPDNIDCVTSDFKACQLYTTPDQPNAVYAFFYGTCVSSTKVKCRPMDTPGVLNDTGLTINLNCDNTNCGPNSGFFPPDWSPGTNGSVTTNVPTDQNGDPLTFPSVPEPATATLLISGIGAAYLKRRRR